MSFDDNRRGRISGHGNRQDHALRRAARGDTARARARQLTLPPAPITVLVADDERDVRRVLVAALQRDGYTTMEARDGRELRAMVESSLRGRGSTVDLVVTDVHMPGLSGLEVLAIVRRLDGSLPVVLIAANPDEDLHDEARSLGADAVLTKPFDLGELRTLVGELVAS